MAVCRVWLNNNRMITIVSYAVKTKTAVSDSIGKLETTLLNSLLNYT